VAVGQAAKPAEKEIWDLFSGTSNGSGAAAAAATAAPALVLQSNPVVDPQTFQARWTALQPCASSELTLKVPSTANQLESLLAKANIHTLASGVVQTFMKFYFHARQTQTSQLFLVEGVSDLKSGRLHCTLKSENPQQANAFLALVKTAIQSLL